MEITNKPINSQNRHQSRHKILIINSDLKNYTIPKLYIPKELKNGKKVASVKAGADWYVYFRIISANGKRKKYMYRRGINKYKTVSLRKAFGKNLIEMFTQLLSEGWQPEQKQPIKPTELTNLLNRKEHNVIEAINIALNHKKGTLKASSYKGVEYRLRQFKKWLEKIGCDEFNVKAIDKQYVIAFLDSINHLSGTSVNNFRRDISSVFGTLSKMGIIDVNIAKELPTIISRPQKNIPFTDDEMQKIKSWLKANDPYLIEFIKYIFYGFLRPIEVIRLETKNIDLHNNIYRVETKKDVLKTKVLIPQLKDYVSQFELSSNDKIWLFTYHNKPSFLESDEKTRYKTMSQRFKKCKDALGFGKLYGFYSFRHSGAIFLYNKFKKLEISDNEIINKMLPITGHKTANSLRVYLRDIEANLPTNYGSEFNIDF